jgi:hypothetical protein
MALPSLSNWRLAQSSAKSFPRRASIAARFPTLAAAGPQWVDRRVSDIRGDEFRAYLGWEAFSFLVFALAVCASVAGLVASVRKAHLAARLKRALQVAAVLFCWLAALWFDAAHRIID